MITVSKNRLAPLRHAWKQGISVGAAHEILRADLQSHLRFLQKEIGYRHIRFHASFHDDVGVVHRGKDGKVYYTWAQLDKIYDFLVEIGFDPIVEINPMPRALASGDATFFWYKMNITPPKVYSEWRDFIRATVLHFTERYGQRRVRDWMFEVWNEPNLKNNFWAGDFDEYIKLYANCAVAVKSVCPEYRIGGPACAGPGWNIDFLKACGKCGAPVDFISFHNYPAGEYCTYQNRQGSPHRPGMGFIDCFREAKEELVKNGYGGLPVICTEWNTLTCDQNGKPQWVGSPDTTRLYSAAAACHYAVGTDPYADVLTWWAASDVFFEAGPHLQVFGQHNQYYGLIGLNGIPKPAFHAFRYLSRIIGPRLETKIDSPPPAQAGICASSEPDCLRLLAWNFQIPQEEGGKKWSDLICIPMENFGSPAQIRITSAHVKAGRGSAYEAWQAWGRPVNLTKLDEEAVFAVSQPEHHVRIVEPEYGQVKISLDLDRDEILFIELRPNSESVNVSEMDESLRKLDSALNDLT